MAQRSHVPEFGNWESDGNVPYTAYFDKARKDRTGGKMINPNDPQENPDMFPNVAPASQGPPSRIRTEPAEPIGRGAARTVHERRISRDDADFRQSAETLIQNDNMGGRAAGESGNHRHGGRGINSGRPVRQSTGSEQSYDRSPLHPHYQPKIVGKGGASPGREGRNSYDSGHGAPGKPRTRPNNRGNETPDRGAAVPKFGDWDENNPSAGDGYTHIFNRVRQERHNGPGMSPGVGNKPSYPAMRKQNTNDDKMSCCFPWGRK